MSSSEKIEKLNELEKTLKKYRSLSSEIDYRIKIINGITKEPTRIESIMHHVYKIFRKEEKISFTQDDYFNGRVLDTDLEFLELIKLHISSKIMSLEIIINSFFDINNLGGAYPRS